MKMRGSRKELSMRVRTYVKKSAGLLPAALLLAGFAGVSISADEGRRTSAPDQDSGGRTRVESSGRSSSASSSHDGGSSSSSDSGRTSVSDRDRHSSSSSSRGERTRVDRRRADSSWHGGHSGGHYDRHRSHYYYPRSSWYVGGYYYWPWWWGGGPYRYYGRYGYDPYGYDGPGYYSSGYDRDSGALDIDVAPENAEIYVDGQYVGVADDFDGFPAYLWLPKGTYDVAIYLPGFTTIARQYSVYPGLVIDVEDEMDQGEAIRPEDLVSKSTVNRDERLRRDREREAELESRERPRRRAPEADRVENQAGRLVLRLEPSDASVYLDGRFLGTAADLGRLHSGLIVDSGEHKLQVVRPGFESETVEFDVEPGEEAEVRLELSEDEDA